MFQQANLSLLVYSVCNVDIFSSNLCLVNVVKCRSPVFSPMQSELLVANVLRRCSEPSTPTFFEFPLELRRELFVSGSQDSKSGHTWKLTLRQIFWPFINFLYRLSILMCFHLFDAIVLLIGCCSWACQRVARQARSDCRKLQWWKHCCLFVGT